MKLWNRFIAALLAAMLLCAAPAVAAEQVALDDGGEILPAQGAAEDGLEIDMEALPELPEDIGLDLDDSMALPGNLDLAGDGSAAGGEERPGEAGTEANASSDFDIRNGVLVKYNGWGGDVVIPDGVTSIGSYAFSECPLLSSVSMPNSVTSIGDHAFSECSFLKSVSMSNSVTSIGEYTFSGCTLLKSVSMPNSVTSIGSYAFYECILLTSLSIPKSVRSIGECAFESCDLTRVTILSKRIDIGKDAFSFCSDKLMFHIISGSNAIAWAKRNGYKYDIYEGISESALTLEPGQTYKLTVGGYENSQLTWSSSNKKVATVSGGKVKAVGAGKCVISAKIEGGKTLKCNVTVTAPTKLDKTSLTLSAVDSATVKLTGASGKKVTWSSSKASVAKISKSSNGSATVAGVKPGTAVIKAKIAGGKTLKCTVKVVAPLKMTTAKLTNESGKRMLYAKFSNQSGKRITYIRCDILQYDSRNQRLESPYDSFDLDTTIKAHTSTTKRVDVNGRTDHVTYRIIEVRFSDGTTWKP